ncbi:Uracil permease protein [Salinisphaera shabanensis E1L3A]|uniref:Uracil permease protein n=1 Tax=Salinisphaera shabanensis E1L3A TaxID=1033802 RepID=U2E5Q9_9GAMM|nr:uracil-xanthine permease family protein [Salinisphaera shabanensis]ERJ19116.1 Uracil permease protein [Salinisphaera shabanensis E1L3A]
MSVEPEQSDSAASAYRFRARDGLLGAQMLFVAFGSLVLVPLLTGLDPNVALFTAGLGTLVFQIVTRGRVPVFLASSFAFIAPIIYGVETWGIPGTLCGLMAAGGVYMLLSLFIRLRGVGVITRLLPTIVTGPVIMVIGLVLAPVAVNLAMGLDGNGNTELVDPSAAMIVSFVSLAVTVAVSLFARGFLSLVPILCGVVAGYLVSLPFGLVDFAPIAAAPWFAMPNFVAPEWNWQAVLFMVPVAIAPAIEHFGDIVAIRSVTGRDYLKDPGIDRTMLGDGLATSLAAALGGPPNTTYSEVTGAVTLTKAYNPALMTWAAGFAIVFAFVGKLGALLASIPTPVMGGIIVLLFGAIIVVGMNSLAKSGEELTEPRNLSIVGIILVTGVGGLSFSAGEFALEGIALAGVLGVLLNLVLPWGRMGR